MDIFTFSPTTNTRLDKAFVEFMPEKSRSYFQKLILEGHVFLNERVILKGNIKVIPNDVITFSLLEEKELAVIAENIPLEIVYEDIDLAIINKPTGMVVHPAKGHISGTLVNALLFHLQDLSAINGIKRPGIVHRIDKDTSGLLIVAKNDSAHTFLAEQLKDKTLYREYIALTHGVIKDSQIIVDAPISRSSVDRKKMAIIENGKPARTHITVVERYEKYTLIKCRLETGRTHQIRVHLKYLGHSLVGDLLYTAKNNEFNLSGQFLHAHKIGFIHPTTKKEMQFTVPLSQQFVDILDKLNSKK